MIDDMKCILSKADIMIRIKEISKRIHHDYKDNPNLVLICVLNGSFMFFNDLLRELTLLRRDNILIDFIKVSSYGNEMVSSKSIKILLDLSINIENKDVIIIEDIIDTRRTINFLNDHIELKKIKSIRIASLLYKSRGIDDNLLIDYKCFKIDDFFAVGYGLDYKQKYRNLEGVYKYKSNEE